jgi:hypothetical protein
MNCAIYNISSEPIVRPWVLRAPFQLNDIVMQQHIKKAYHIWIRQTRTSSRPVSQALASGRSMPWACPWARPPIPPCILRRHRRWTSFHPSQQRRPSLCPYFLPSVGHEINCLGYGFHVPLHFVKLGSHRQNLGLLISLVGTRINLQQPNLQDLVL